MSRERGRPRNDAAQQLADKARALHALSCLMQLVVTARTQTDIVTWQQVGGLEAENFLDALERGLAHPLLQEWLERKSDGGRPNANLRERHFRRLAVLLSTALQRALGRGKVREARNKTAKALAGLLTIASYKSIERWELELEPPLSDEDEAVFTAAFERCGPNPKALIRHFVGFVHFPLLTPAPKAIKPQGLIRSPT